MGWALAVVWSGAACLGPELSDDAVGGKPPAIRDSASSANGAEGPPRDGAIAIGEDSAPPGASGNPDSGWGGTPNDELAAYRTRCLDRINALRATQSLAPYTQWSGVEACVDAQASADEASGVPHQAFAAGSTCNGSAQNECLGHGAAGIEQCLDLMWSEKDLPACTGCGACSGPPGCQDCDYPVCGHYVNMSAPSLSQVACGFSTFGARGWAVQNFR